MEALVVAFALLASAEVASEGSFDPPAPAPSEETPAAETQPAATATRSAAAPHAGPADVSGTPAAPTATPTISPRLPVKFRFVEKAVSPGRHVAVVLREELDLRGTVRCEKVILKGGDGTVPDAVLFEAPGGLWGLRWSPDASLLAVHQKLSEREGRLLLFHRQGGAVVDAGAPAVRALREGAAGFPHAIFFSPDGRSLLVSAHLSGNGPATLSRPGALFIVDTASGEVRRRVEWE